MSRVTLAALGAALALAVSSPASAACTVLAAVSGKPARVHLPSGAVDDAVVVVQGKELAAVGRLPLTGLGRADGGFTWKGAPCDVVDTSEREVTAGLVAVMSQIGLVEVSLESATRNADAGGDDPVRAALRVADAYDPWSTLIPVQRVQGITAAVIAPTGGRISGQAAWVELGGATQAAAVSEPSVAMVGSMGGESRAEGLLELRELLDDAKVYAARTSAFEQNRTRAFAASRLDLQALGEVVRGEIPLVIGADRAADLEALLRLRSDLGIDLVISGAAEGWMVADRLAAAGVPVIVDPFVYGPGSFDQVRARPDNAALLVAAGVPVILSTWGSHNARTLRQVAGNAVRGGLDHAAALRAITSVPSEVFGMADHGRLEVGAAADLVVWTGDPLELTTSAEAVIVQGRQVSLETRQKALLDRYRKLPGTPIPPLAP